ncbi:MAG: cytochrome C [Sphingobium sp.]|jgi:hypothetical protein|nr:MAG: cytochrome C [Sphingobium sp.]
MRRGGRLALLGMAGLAVGAGAATQPGKSVLPAAITDPVLARSDYVENCGGCHGVEGRSAPAQLPELRDRVGYFMCTPQARAYLIRLPNVAHSRITDNQQLADLVNFVVFGLGGASTRPDAVPFSAEEVARERRFALSSASLKAERARHVEAAIRKCHAPVSLRALYPSPPG